jgi:hypothetical protein
MLPLSRTLIMLSILAAVLVACGGTSAATPLASPSGTPTAPPNETPTPAASPSVGESESPSVSPSPSVPAGPTPPTIGLDTVVRTTVNGLRLREQPTTGASSLGTLANGAQSYVVDGPVAGDGYSWYLLAGLGIPQYSGCSGPMITDPWVCPVWFGWAAAASPDGDTWLAEDELDCPAWPENATYDITYGVQRIAYLACYGDEERTLTGFYPLIPDDAGLGGACAGVPDSLGWIGCNLGYEHVNPSATDPYGSGFVFSVDGTAVPMPDRGQWVRLSGRFDHPAAADCTFGDPPIRSVLQCRAQFVVERAEVVAAP